MWLEQIVLDGFKSYAQVTTISPFDKSFTAITGLNGSGKSNIFDAICFVLGISQLSRIRVSNMIDLIYKQGQAGISKASVSLVFNNDNSAKSPQGYEQFKKLIITRQIFSNGTTKYLLNDQVAKQKTIKQLFQSTGMNINNPNFLIMQGRIQAILNMKPLELLSLLEETAGTLMYDQNKKDAEKTFDQKELRLNQIRKTINEEIKPKIQQLEKDRVISVQISQLQKGIKGLEIVNNIFSLFQAVDEITQINDQQQLNKETENTLRQDILQDEQQLSEKQIQLNQIMVEDIDQHLIQQYDNNKNQIALAAQNLQERQHKISELQKERENKHKQIKRIQTQIDNQKQVLAKNQEYIGQFEQKIDALNNLKRQEIAIQQQVDLIKTGNIDNTYLAGIIDQSSDHYKQLQKKLFPKNESISIDELQSRTEAQIIKEQNYLGQMQGEIQSIQQNLSQLDEQKVALQNDSIQIQSQIVMNIKKINMIIKQVQQMYANKLNFNQITIQNDDFTNIGTQIDEFILQLKTHMNQQKKSLQDVQFQIKKFSKQQEQSKQELLDQFQHNCNNKSGLQIMNMVNKAKSYQNNTYNIMGIVIDFVVINMDVLNQYANQKSFSIDQILTAAQNFAITKFFNIIFERVEDASRFISSQHCTVRCTALPLDNIQDSHIQQSRINKVHQYGGIMLTEIFKPIDSSLNSVFNSLFGHLVVCKDIQTAKQIAYDVECKFKCITFDQDIVDPSGVVSGGVKKTGGDFVSFYCKLRDFNPGQQLEELHTGESNLQNSINQVIIILQNAQQLQQQITVQLEQLNQGRYSKVCQQINTKQQYLVQTQQNIENLQYFMQIYQQILQYLNNNQQNMNQKQLNSQLQSLKKEIKTKQQEIDSFQNSQTYKSVQDMKLQLQVDNEEIQAINSSLQEIEQEIQNATTAIEKYKLQKIQLGQQLQSTEQIIQQQSSNRREQVEQQARIKKEIDLLSKKLNQKRQKFSQLSAENIEANNQYHIKFNQAQDLLSGNAENLSIIQALDQKQFEIIQQTFKLPKKTSQLGIKYLAQYLFDSGVVEPVMDNSDEQLRQLITDVFPRAGKLTSTLNHQLVELQQSNKNVVASTANLEELQKSAKQLQQMEQKLLEDKEKIIGLITKVDERKSAALEELFQSVNVNMSAIFGVLLPGGFVKLEKVRENDISKGVQFNIRLGETNTTLSGLSGGQKSLLALSFTLALLRYKPSPIYILDEIDAALDLSHTHGIGRLIQQEFQDSQFIIISLKEGMFNHANQLFKIKFVDGISKVERIK